MESIRGFLAKLKEFTAPVLTGFTNKEKPARDILDTLELQPLDSSGEVEMKNNKNKMLVNIQKTIEYEYV
jgi:hypothetical protein